MCNVLIAIQQNKVLQGIYELEKKIKKTIPLPQKILFAATGTLERTLSLLIDSETEVMILEQKDFFDIIFRSVNIVQKQNGKVLVNAKSKIYPYFLPNNVVKKVREKKESIGDIIESESMETFRNIRALGYNCSAKNFTKIYHIIHQKNIAFNIQEVFVTELHQHINGSG
jgi:chorismate-pyruvate lyase